MSGGLTIDRGPQVKDGDYIVAMVNGSHRCNSVVVEQTDGGVYVKTNDMSAGVGCQFHWFVPYGPRFIISIIDDPAQVVALKLQGLTL